MRKTKIICTLGPSTDKDGVLEELIKEGDAIYIKGHEAHASLIQQEARGDWNGNTLFPLYFVTNSKQDLLKDL